MNIKLPRQVDIFSHQGFKRAGALNHGNEDMFLHLPPVFAVIDGATAMIPDKLDGLTGAQYIARFIMRELAALSADNNDTHTARELLMAINSKFATHLQRYFPDVAAQGKYGPSAAAVLVKLHRDGTYTYAQVADCFLVECTTDGDKTLLTADQVVNLDENGTLKRAREKVAQGLPPEDVLSDPEVKAQLKANRLKNNVIFGVVNGEKAMENMVQHGRRPIEGVRWLSLMSDGMVNSLLWPKASREDKVIRSAQAMSAQGVYGHWQNLKELLDADPVFARYPRFKHMDDATGMVLHFA